MLRQLGFTAIYVPLLLGVFSGFMFFPVHYTQISAQLPMWVGVLIFVLWLSSFAGFGISLLSKPIQRGAWATAALVAATIAAVWFWRFTLPEWAAARSHPWTIFWLSVVLWIPTTTAAWRLVITWMNFRLKKGAA